MTRRHLRGRYGAGVRLAVVGLRTVELSMVLASVLLAVCPRAFALNPALDVSQYAHTAWKIRDGFTKGGIGAMAQTPDGYLWLGTEFGLYRFDGVRAVPWQPPARQHLPSNYIRALLASRDGTLWIGTLKGLASWKDGKLLYYSTPADQSIDTLLEDDEGTIWIGTLGTTTGRLCVIRVGGIQCYGEDGSFGKWIEFLLEDSAKNVWAASATGLWRLKPGPPKRYSMPSPIAATKQTLVEASQGALLVITASGIERFVNEKINTYLLPRGGRKLKMKRLFRDRSGGLWAIGAEGGGLAHAHDGKTDFFSLADGLSGDHVLILFEDREGDIWVGTDSGLDRFRDYAVTTFSLGQGTSDAGVWSALAAADGDVWLGTEKGLDRWSDGRISAYDKRGGKLNGLAPHCLFQDRRGQIWVSTFAGFGHLENTRFIPVSGIPGGIVRAIAEDASGDLWIANQSGGLIRLRNGNVVQQIPWTKLGHQDFAVALGADPSGGGLWLGFYNGGVVHFSGGQVRAAYTAADGLGEGFVGRFRFDDDGTVWSATQGGLSRMKNGHVATLTTKNGLPCDAVSWVIRDNDHSLWLGMACGLVRINRSELDAWAAAVDKGRVDKGKDTKQAIQATVFDISDGVRSARLGGGFSPAVTRSSDGTLWFTSADGVSVVDPAHLPFNKLPPPVHIEQIIVDRRTYEAVSGGSGQVRLPARVRDLEIDYTALSLVAPEKVRFRYKLEGRDSDWQDAGNRRQAFYSDLPPRSYRFRVMACNNSGVWNETGAFLDFSVAPAYYQTWWFRLSLVAALMTLLWALYQMRLHQLAREFNAGLEARVAERTRIARELHDSLLQGFQGLIFRFQAAREFLPGRPNEATEALDLALKRADKVIIEGRDTVSDLRQSVVEDSDIGQALTALGEELAAQSDNGSVPCVRVLVEGTQRELDPMLRDEIYRIGREAMRNAFGHARAQKIEAEITYGDSEFVFHVRDDGIGIPPEVADHGTRPGHWGLPGMRERAKNFGGKLEVWSEQGAGTEIELTIPAAIAYGGSNARPRFWFLRKNSQAIDGHKS